LRVLSAVQLEIVKEGWPRIGDRGIVHSPDIILIGFIAVLGCVLGLTRHSLARAHVLREAIFSAHEFAN
jgi:hypothetical protein